MSNTVKYQDRVSINLLLKQKSTLVSLWNELNNEPVKNKVKIQHIDGLINLIYVMVDKLLEEGEVRLIEDRF